MEELNQMLTELRYASEEYGRSAGIEKYKKWADEECEIIRKHVSDLILAERERCAGICEGIAARPSIDWGAINPLADAAAEIRSGDV